MTLDRLREFCLSLAGTSEKMPFVAFPSANEVLCFYVGDKIFCLTDIREFTYCNLKGLPEDNIDMCERYRSISLGFHMNKRHWISVGMEGDVPDAVLESLILRSYALVRSSLPKRVRDTIAE